MKRKFKWPLLIFMLLISLLSCSNKPKNKTLPDDKVIAKVGSKYLYQSQINELISEGTSPTDSVTIVNGFLQNWIREGLVILEAEKQVAADLNLDKLVDDYRSSLLVYNFENKLIENQLDTVVTISEKQEFYEMHKNNYRLSHPIFKCLAGKFSKKNKNLKNIEKAFSNLDLYSIETLASREAITFFADTSRYMIKEDLLTWMPSEVNNKIKKSQKPLKFSDSNYEYFVKMVEFYDENDIPPFSYIESKIEKTILSERKNKLLKDFRQQLYLKGISENKFEIYNIQD